MANPDPPDDRREEPVLTPDQARPNVIPEFLQAVGPAPGAAPGHTPERHGMPPDPGCYEARYGLTRWPKLYLVLARDLGLLAVGIFGHVTTPWRVSFIAVGAISVRYVIVLFGRKVAFRADQAGITLPATPFARFVPRAYTAWARTLAWPPTFESFFAPWADVKQIIFDTTKWRGVSTPYIRIELRDASAPPAPSRSITMWRLDRERLAAIVAAAAPGVAILYKGTWPVAKMTPEQEAEYALGFGVARSDLSKDAQLAYDRLVEQRARAGTPPPGSQH